MDSTALAARIVAEVLSGPRDERHKAAWLARVLDLVREAAMAEERIGWREILIHPDGTRTDITTYQGLGERDQLFTEAKELRAEVERLLRENEALRAEVDRLRWALAGEGAS